MKGKTPEQMIKEKLEKIEALKKADECTLDCKDKDTICFPYFQTGLTSNLLYPVIYQSVKVNTCKNGYIITECPIYKAKIESLKKDIKVLSEEIKS